MQRWLWTILAIPLSWGWSWESGSAQIDRDHPRSLAFTEVSASGSLVQKSYMRHGFDYNTDADSAAAADMYQLTLLDGAETATSQEAIVTHVCGKDWAPGALALAASLRAAGTSRNLVLMVTDTVGRRYQKLFAAVFDKVYIEEPVKPHDSITRDGADCVTLQLRAWELPYKKVLYMDADIIALKTHDPVLDSFGELAAKTDAGLTEQFNGGMFVLEPSDEKFHHLRQLLKKDFARSGSNGGIQQFLNYAFPPCDKASMVGCWGGKMEDTYNKFTRDVSKGDLDSEKFASLHFSGDWGGSRKPWMSGCLAQSDSSTHKAGSLQSKLLQIWMDAFHQVHAPEGLEDLLHTDCPGEES
ncbi:GYG1 [Symbiodinium sp. CCMP2456]|nr:GYG1 [Symbiodinium sp. CCMP2456]